MFYIMQGDSYSLAIKILDDSKNPVTADNVLDVEIAIGTLIKTFANGELTYGPDEGVWNFPLTQEESFAYRPSVVKCSVRVKRKNEADEEIVNGTPLGEARILESQSKAVL